MQREECIICFNSQYSDNPVSPKRYYSTPCNHHFHFKCLKRWCKINNSCPTCRRHIIMNLPNNNENYQDYDSAFYLSLITHSSPPEPSSPPHSSLDRTHYFDPSNNDNISQENYHYDNFNMINIDNVLDNMRNDYNDAGIVSPNNLSEYHRTFGYSTISRHINNYQLRNRIRLPFYYTRQIRDILIPNTINGLPLDNIAND